MQPVLLGLTPHDQQITMAQRPLVAVRIALCPRPQHKTPGMAQRQRRNDRLRPQFGLIVRMPAHTVLTMLIEIAQYRIEPGTAVSGQPGAQCPDLRIPGNGYKIGTGIAIHRVGLTHPDLQPGLRHGTTKQKNIFLLPG